MEAERLISFMREAYSVAHESRDPNTQNGAIIVEPKSGEIICGGCNNIPDGSSYDSSRLTKKLGRYLWTEHAERDAIYRAARLGKETNNCWMICCWSACMDCARAIALSGISKLVRHSIPQHDERMDWKETILLGDQLMNECGVDVMTIEGHIDTLIRFNGKTIEV